MKAIILTDNNGKQYLILEKDMAAFNKIAIEVEMRNQYVPNTYTTPKIIYQWIPSYEQFPFTCNPTTISQTLDISTTHIKPTDLFTLTTKGNVNP